MSRHPTRYGHDSDRSRLSTDLMDVVFRVSASSSSLPSLGCMSSASLYPSTIHWPHLALDWVSHVQPVSRTWKEPSTDFVLRTFRLPTTGRRRIRTKASGRISKSAPANCVIWRITRHCHPKDCSQPRSVVGHDHRMLTSKTRKMEESMLYQQQLVCVPRCGTLSSSSKWEIS
jgi:hypothetical protein